ncbi:hypothetical protein K458DRAFT_286145 [Lentithecium fluviatile CBS 122367]|uniref:DUF7703 domain-containing protein n=1 Tax=Lentithecium fluviatile CBS 122367 TaxID=1168545 RepID=A0A6G1JM09_9PLEO|nr:hypothetical protein K458DRAFT_286145 [Lentithecium fluviatile CBS 122367]
MNSDTNHFAAWDSTSLTLLVCSALALYNAVEMELLVFTTFHNYRGLYFYSMVLASFGIIPYVLGFFVEYFRWSHMSLGTAIVTAGWSLMVTGQSVVLYSRLWLVFQGGHKRLLKGVKWMIVIDGLVFHGVTTIVVFGSRSSSSARLRNSFGDAYNVVERIQMCGFCAQELILSGIYIWKALDIINASERKRSHKLMWQLFIINVIIVILDIALLTFEFRSLHVIQQTVKGLTYSVKLKLEFAILNKLIELSHSNARVSEFTFGDTNEFLDPTKTVWDITRFTPGFSNSMYTYPKWKSDLEKSGLQRIESAYSPTESTWVRARHATPVSADANEYFADKIQPAATIHDPRADGRDRGSATDLLYADAVQRMAAPGPV